MLNGVSDGLDTIIGENGAKSSGGQCQRVGITRANYLEKRMLNIAQTLYKEKKLPNMAIVLNDTETKRTCGYGYAYGAGYLEQTKKYWYKKY